MERMEGKDIWLMHLEGCYFKALREVEAKLVASLFWGSILYMHGKERSKDCWLGKLGA